MRKATDYDSLPTTNDVAWSYDQAIDEMQVIAGQLAFDDEKGVGRADKQPGAGNA